jgi:hypothetical protein
MADTEHTPGPMDSLIADFKLSMKRLKDTPLKTPEDVTKELRFNVYPSMIALAEQIAEVDDVIQEVVEQQDSYVQPDLAAQILSTVAAAGMLAEEVKRALPALDDLTRKKLLDLIRAFEHSAEITVTHVAEATVEEYTPGDDENEDEDEDDENEDDEEKTPVEIPSKKEQE